MGQSSTNRKECKNSWPLICTKEVSRKVCPFLFPDTPITYSLWLLRFPILWVKTEKVVPYLAYFSGYVKTFWPYPYYWKPSKPIGTNLSSVSEDQQLFPEFCSWGRLGYEMHKKKKALSLGGGGIRVHVPPYRLYYLGRLRDFSPVPVGPLVSSFHLVCSPLIFLRKYPACHPTQNQSALLSF